MNFAHLHLVITHFPPVLTLGGAVSAAVGVVRRRRELVRLALILLVAVGAMMPVVYIAGERAADSIGKVDGVQQEAIAPHQRAAKIALVVSIATGLLAAGFLRIDGRRWVQILVFVIAIAAAIPIAWTAALGGAIHHPEISSR
jgi:uncharacterized membrane protein